MRKKLFAQEIPLVGITEARMFHCGHESTLDASIQEAREALEAHWNINGGHNLGVKAWNCVS